MLFFKKITLNNGGTAHWACFASIAVAFISSYIRNVINDNKYMKILENVQGMAIFLKICGLCGVSGGVNNLCALNTRY